MKSKFSLHAEYLLPDGFEGGFDEAFELFVKHCRKEWKKQAKIPSHLPEKHCFEYVLDQGGTLYTSYAIELFPFSNFTEEDEYEATLEEQENEALIGDGFSG